MPPTQSLIALKQYMKGAGCLCGVALSVNAFRRCHLPQSGRQGLFCHVLGSPFGRAVERSETERARSLPAALPSPSRLTPCHLSRSERHWHIGSAYANRAKLCITQNAGPCRPDSQVRCCESRPQGPVVIVMRSDLPGLPRAPPLGELAAKQTERAKNTPYHRWYGVCGNDSDKTQTAGSVIRSQNTVMRVLPP